MEAHLLAFLGVSALVICTPGPDTALTLRNALSGGRRGGVATATGVALGQATWSLAASAGVAAALAAWRPAFDALRLAGAAYLIWLGIQSLRGHGGRRIRPGRPVSPRRALRQGLLSNLGNPKMAVFFTSLLPQFAATFPELLALGLGFCALTLLWLCGYALAVARARRVLERARVRRALEAATGAVLVALGVRVATD